MMSATSREKAYFAPFLAFLGLIMLGDLIAKPFEGRQAGWFLSDCQYWVDPAQTLVCGALLWRWRQLYDLHRPRNPGFAVFAGILVILLWIAPQEFWSGSAVLLKLGFVRAGAALSDGFDPYFFGSSGPAFCLNLTLRFLRLVVVVPFVEEIFWRGFLLRYLINADFTRVPFGAFTWTSFLITTAGFMFEHRTADWPAALLTGAAFNLLAYRTKSLSSCILAHAAANLLLGIYVLRTGYWGFW